MQQFKGEPRRRWFSDEYFDLIVWYDGSDAILGFQLCYDLGRDEHTLTWRSGRGAVHQRVDGGETRPHGFKRAPLLVPEGRVDSARLAALFAEHSRDLDPELADFVCAQIKNQQTGS